MASRLFSDLKLRDLVVPNRIFMAPMCQYSARDGLANQWHLIHYAARAVGGCGLVIVEATGVLPEGRISPHDLGLWNAEQMESLKPVARAIREHGAVAAIQLGHAGRKGSCQPPAAGGRPIPFDQEGGWRTVAPSALPFAEGDPTPNGLTEEDLSRIVQAFAQAARRAAEAGFQTVEVHMAHGYLLHQFLSPLSNIRTDRYGGDWENRVRFPLEVAQAVCREWPDTFPVMVRISATDWKTGGWDLDQSVAFAKRLKEVGVDFIDVSAGGLLPNVDMPVAPGFQIPFATAIREEAQVATGAVGLITEPGQAEQIVVSGQADAVLLGRVLLREPYWPLNATRALNVDYPWPVQYLAGRK